MRSDFVRIGSGAVITTVTAAAAAVITTAAAGRVARNIRADSNAV